MTVVMPGSDPSLIDAGPIETRSQSCHRLFLGLRAARTDQERAECRALLVDQHIGLARFLACRFANRGEPVEDLVQVASLGLLKAIERFDPDRGVEFATFTTPTIIGELKRFFRDTGWSVRVPRRLQELHLELKDLIGELSQSLGRSPTVEEMARAVRASEEEVLEALEIGFVYDSRSLDAPVAGDEAGAHTFADLLGGDDREMEKVDNLVSLRDEIAKLPSFEQEVLFLRFFKGMSQAEIGGRLGVSQMQVCRVLQRTFAFLRRGLEPTEAPARHLPEIPA